MIRLILFIIMVSSAFPLTAQTNSKKEEKRKEQQEEEERRKIARLGLKKSMFQLHECRNSGKPKNKSEVVGEVTYNEDGRITYSKDVNTEMITENAYDEKGNLIETKKMNLDQELIEKETYEYNDKNLQVKIKTYKPTGYIKRTTNITYTDFDKRKERVTLKPNGNPEQKDIYTYDENENLVKWVVYGINDRYIKEFRYIYDEEQNERERKIYNEDTVLIKTLKFSYNEDNLVEGIQVFEKDELQLRYVRTYNQDGLLTSEIVVKSDGSFYSKKEQIWRKGQLIEEVQYAGFSKVKQKIRTTYNDKGLREKVWFYENDEDIPKAMMAANHIYRESE